MKDGRTHLAHKAEHAVDLDTGAVVAVTLQGADKGDTTTLDATLSEAGMAVAEQVGREAELRPHASAQGERGRDRGDGDRQGLPQRRGGEADEGVRRAHLGGRYESVSSAFDDEIDFADFQLTQESKCLNVGELKYGIPKRVRIRPYAHF